MKNYKEVQMFAKNAPTGSYAAGCPDHHKEWLGGSDYTNVGTDGQKYGTGACYVCELARWTMKLPATNVDSGEF